MGTSGKPLRRTRGVQNLGEGGIEWSDEGERDDFLTQLTSSDSNLGWAEVEFKVTIVYRAKNRPSLKHTLLQCRVLDVEVDHAQGAEALGGATPISFMDREINGKKAIME